MSLTLKNSFYSARANEPIKLGKFVDKLCVCTPTPDFYEGQKKIEAFFAVDEKGEIKTDKICLTSLLLEDKILDAVIDYVYTNKCKFMVRACENLYESGVIEAKYHLSPIMLLHKMGLLENATIVGANHIDKDDIDLLAQCNAKIVFLPSYSMGMGNGTPPISFALDKIDIGLGTANNAFNTSADILFEARLAYLTASSEMRKNNAISAHRLLNLCGKGDIEQFKLELQID